MNIGQIIAGRFELGRPFESSTDSEVFLARDRRKNQLVIVKLLKRKDSQEAALLQEVHHEGIIRPLCCLKHAEGTLLIEEFFPGISLRHYVLKHGRLSVDDALQIAKQICGILQYLHSRKPPVIYRDLKPDNLLIEKDGKIKLIDFGAAKRYVLREDQDEICLGTKGYAAPEQYEDSHCQSDVRTDIFGFGATLFFMLTGQEPDGTEAAFRRICTLRPDIPKTLGQILIRCTAADPEKRYDSMDCLRYDLQCLGGEKT